MPKERFELDRLVEELGVDKDAEQDGVTHDLPTLEPLSHEHPHLKAPTFDAEDFLLSRAYTSLPDLGSELKEYLARLKEELVQLINDDYEAFISLSTDLRGEGARLERLHFPLPALRKEIEVRYGARAGSSRSHCSALDGRVEGGARRGAGQAAGARCYT